MYQKKTSGYAPGGTILENVSEEKDIWVMVHESLKPSLHCSKSAKKANSVLGQIFSALGQYCLDKTAQDICTTTSGVFSTDVEPMVSE